MYDSVCVCREPARGIVLCVLRWLTQARALRCSLLYSLSDNVGAPLCAQRVTLAKIKLTSTTIARVSSSVTDVHSGAELIINASDVFSPCLSIPNSQRERRKYESIFLTTKSKCQLVSSWCQFSAWETVAVVLEAYAGKMRVIAAALP